MAIQSSGTISMTDIVAEFGGSVPHSLSEYYRNGGAVPGNNTNVPTSGTISMSNFYSAVNEIQVTVSSSSTNYQTSNAFGSNWSTAVPKRLTINSGVTLGSSNGNPAMVIEGSMGGTLIVHNNGSIHGTGGAGSNSGAGGNAGPAVRADQNGNVTFYNNSGGQVYAGGGGGGKGGTGGTAGAGGTGGAGGAGNYTQGGGYTGQWTFGYGCHYYNGLARVGFGNYNKDGCICGLNQQFYPGATGYSASGSSQQSLFIRGRFRHGQTQVTCNYHLNSTGGSGGSGGSGGAGGAGGAGGNGQGYNQSRQNGSGGSGGAAGVGGAGGSAGGTNAGSGGSGGQGGTGGTGGAGGNGGDWGQAGGSGNTGIQGGTGNTGNPGGNGNSSNGSGGATGSGGGSGSGGASGGATSSYVQNRGYITFHNSGSVAGN